MSEAQIIREGGSGMRAENAAEQMFWTLRVERDYLEDLAECGTIRPEQLARLVRANARIAGLVYPG